MLSLWNRADRLQRIKSPIVRPAIGLAQILLSLASAHADVPNGPYAYITVPNVLYGPVAPTGDEASGSISGNTLYECLPQPTQLQWAGPYPIVMFVHGGDWNAGYADYDVPQCQKWASRGFAAFSINYRLQAKTTAPTHDGYPAPAQLVDVQLALRWLRSNAARLNLSRAEATCFGDSAGAALCEQAAFYPGTYPSSGDPAASLYPGYSSKAQSVVAEFGPSLFGPAPLTSDLVQMYYTNSSKAVIVQGSLDKSVPEANSLAVYQTLHDHHRPVLYIPFVGGHEFSGVTDSDKTAIKTQEMRAIGDHVRYFGFPVSEP